MLPYSPASLSTYHIQVQTTRILISHTCALSGWHNPRAATLARITARRTRLSSSLESTYAAAKPTSKATIGVYKRVDAKIPKLPIFSYVNSSSIIIDSFVSPALESVQHFLCNLSADVKRWVQQSASSPTWSKLLGAGTYHMYSEG